MKRSPYVWIALMILAGASIASAQSTTQEQPLGDYARAVRKDKKPASAKQFDNDNLPPDNKLNIVGVVKFNVPTDKKGVIEKLLDESGSRLSRNNTQASPGELTTDKKYGYAVTISAAAPKPWICCRR